MAERYHGNIEIFNTRISSFTNAFFVQEGKDIKVQNVSIDLEPNQIRRVDNISFYDYFLEMNNSTRKQDEEYFREQQKKWINLPHFEKQ